MGLPHKDLNVHKGFKAFSMHDTRWLIQDTQIDGQMRNFGPSLSFHFIQATRKVCRVYFGFLRDEDQEGAANVPSRTV